MLKLFLKNKKNVYIGFLGINNSHFYDKQEDKYPLPNTHANPHIYQNKHILPVSPPPLPNPNHLVFLYFHLFEY